MSDHSEKVISNLIWRFAERTGAKAVGFVVSIILARILEPEAYGTVALIAVFTSILQVFIDSGLGNALIQKKDADDVDFSTVFYVNIVFCAVLYALLFAAAPLIAAFYEMPELTPYVRVLGLTVLISGVKNIQQAYVSRHLIFRKFFFATLGGTIVAAIAAIAMALNGFGVWALVTQQVINVVIDTIILWITVKWRPIRAFSLVRLKGLFSYGWKLLLSSLLDTGYGNLWQLIIGKQYSSADLAYYNKASSFPSLIITNINSSIDSVLLPTMADAQDDRARVKQMTRRAVKTSTYILSPLMVGLAACAEQIILVLLTDKWIACVPFLQIFSIAYLLTPIHTANLNAIKSVGRSDIFLRQEVVKKITGLLILVFTMPHGVLIMALGELVNCFLCLFINAWPNQRLLGYSLLEQMRDIFSGVALAVFMGVIVYCMGFLPIPTALILIIQIAAGAIIYIGGSALLRIEAYEYLIDMAKNWLQRRRAR